MKTVYLWAALALGLPSAALAQPALEGLTAPHDHHPKEHHQHGHDDHDDHDHHEPHTTVLSNAEAKVAGVTTATALLSTVVSGS